MRPPPKRTMHGQAERKVSASLSTRRGASPAVEPNSTESAVAATSSGSAIHGEGQQSAFGESIPKPSYQAGDTVDFSIGDTVTVRTAGKPAREATIVEAAVDGSRFNVTFKDKRRKGGWRDKGDLSPFMRNHQTAGDRAVSLCASSVDTTSTVLPAGAAGAGAGAACAGAGAGAGAAGAATVPSSASLSASGNYEAETNNRVRRRPYLPKGNDKNSAIDKPTSAIGGNHHRPTVNNAENLQAPTPEQNVQTTTQQTQRTSSNLATADKVEENIREPIIDGTHQEAVPQPPIALEAGTFRIGDSVTVKVTTHMRHILPTATVVGVDTSKSPSLFKLRFKDKRKKQMWKTAIELIPAVPAPPSSQGAVLDASVADGAEKPTQNAPSSSGSDLRGENADSNAMEHGNIAAAAPRAGKDNSHKSTADSDQGGEHAEVALDGNRRTGTGVDRDGKEGRQRRAASKSSEETNDRVGLESKARLPESTTGQQSQPGQQLEEPRFQVGAAIRIEGGRGRGAGGAATVVEVDASTTPHRFRVAFKNKRKKDAWKTTEELIPATAAAAAAGDQARYCEVPPPVPPKATKTSTSEKTPAVAKDNLLGELQHDKTTTRTTVTKQVPTDTTSPAQPTSYVEGGKAPCEGGRSKVGTGARATGGGASAAPIAKKKGKAKAKTSERVKAVSSTKAPRTPAKKWKLPILATPGVGEPESALRTTHPTEALPRRKRFKIQQQARAMPKQAPPSSFSTTTSAATKSRTALRRPLCQPAHTVDEVERHKNCGQQRQQQPDAAGGFDSDVRRSRRSRKQMHQNLSEAVMEAFGDVVDSGDDAEGGGSGEGREGGEGTVDAEVPLRFRKSSDAPWGAGNQPLIKVWLSLLEAGAPLSAERSALAVVKFVHDRHRYSGEQLANVLTADGFLCYRDEDSRVFVLTEKSEAKQKEYFNKVTKLALSRCGVKVDVSPWLVGRAALNEFLDNHRRVVDHIIRHRMALGMWSEVGGVYFNALFCGRRAKRTFNGVRLGINLAASDNATLETGVWELWITVEPAVYRFAPMDWWSLMQEKEDKGLADFSGSKSDDLEEKLQVICLPKLSRGVIHDVKEDMFEMDRLQEVNLSRGYLVGPRSEDEMVEYWRQVHHINLPSTNFVFVKVRIGGMVLTYPSWCVIRGQTEVPEATRALRGRILEAFTDALDAMEGITVMETTFSWHLDGKGGSASGSTPAFVTANGTVVGEKNNTPPSLVSPLVEPSPHDDGGDTTTFVPNLSFMSTPGPTPGKRCGGSIEEGADENNEPRTPSIVTPHTVSTPPRPLDAPYIVGTPMPSTRIGSSSGSGSSNGGVEDVATGGGESPESRAAAAAAQASVAAVRKSVIRRRGKAPAPARPNRASPGEGEAEGAAVETPTTSKSLCSTPFMIRRPPSSAQHNSTTAATAGEVGKTNLGLGRPLHLLSGGRGASGTAAQASKAGSPPSFTKTGGAVRAVVGMAGGTASTVPDTPQGAGNGTRMVPLVTPTVEEGASEAAGKTPSGKGLKRKTPDDSSTRTPASGIGGETEKESSGKCSASDPPPAVVVAEGTTAVSNPVPASAAPAPTPLPPVARKIVVTFAAAGSLGMGLGEDETEEGTVVLGGKAPTSAAVPVPDGWRLTEVDGKCMRRLGAEKIASYLQLRPVKVTFEEILPTEAAATIEPPPSEKPSAKNTPAATKKSAAAPRKRAPAKPKGKGKKAAKVTTVRKSFKVQSRGPVGGGAPGAPGVAGVAGAAKKIVPIQTSMDMTTI